MVAEICIIGDGYSSAVLLLNLAKNETANFCGEVVSATKIAHQEEKLTNILKNSINGICKHGRPNATFKKRRYIVYYARSWRVKKLP